jgi:hypothetical protein
MKKMHVIWLFMGCLLLSSGILMGQGRHKSPEDSLECLRRLSFYKENVKAGDFMGAIPSWRKAMAICPIGINQNLYVDGIQIVKRMIGAEGGSPARRSELVDTLMMLYDIRIENYPRNAPTALQNKINEIMQYLPAQKDFLDGTIRDWLGLVNNEAEAAILLVHMQNTMELYAEKAVDAEAVMDTYNYVIEIIEEQEKTKNSEQLQATKQMIENILISSDVATCENLIALFTPRFAANPNDSDLVGKIVGMLNNSGCETSELFLQAVTALNAMKPSYKTAYYLYRLHISRDEMDQAIAYLQEAINSEDAPDVDKGSYLIELGILMLRTNNQTRAANAARQAMEKNPEMRGRANMLLGSIWASLKCDGNEIEKRAQFWVAVDFFNKAKAADSLLAEEADRYIRTYRDYFPMQEDAFMHDIMDGSSYTVSCGGLRETTTVRTRK